jgi:hypothetical protein
MGKIGFNPVLFCGRKRPRGAPDGSGVDKHDGDRRLGSKSATQSSENRGQTGSHGTGRTRRRLVVVSRGVV